ncbi:MAG: hypothetical protein V4651_08565, partial [Bacteroidota bacterium]
MLLTFYSSRGCVVLGRVSRRVVRVDKEFKDWGDQFQTPDSVCRYMASFLPVNAGDILEPTPGRGNLVRALQDKGTVHAPENLRDLERDVFDWVVMNPPFTPMSMGYEILFRCMEMTDHVVALMPYLAIINSEKRLARIMDYGLRSIT